MFTVASFWNFCIITCLNNMSTDITWNKRHSSKQITPITYTKKQTVVGVLGADRAVRSRCSYIF